MGWLLKTMNSVDGVEVDCLRSTVRGDLSKDSKDCVADFNGDAAGLVSGGSAGESPDCFGVVDMEGIDGKKEVRLALFEVNKRRKRRNHQSRYKNRLIAAVHCPIFGKYDFIMFNLFLNFK